MREKLRTLKAEVILEEEAKDKIVKAKVIVKKRKSKSINRIGVVENKG